MPTSVVHHLLTVTNDLASLKLLSLVITVSTFRHLSLSESLPTPLKSIFFSGRSFTVMNFTVRKCIGISSGLISLGSSYLKMASTSAGRRTNDSWRCWLQEGSPNCNLAWAIMYIASFYGSKPMNFAFLISSLIFQTMRFSSRLTLQLLDSSLVKSTPLHRYRSIKVAKVQISRLYSNISKILLSALVYSQTARQLQAAFLKADIRGTSLSFSSDLAASKMHTLPYNSWLQEKEMRLVTTP